MYGGDGADDGDDGVYGFYVGDDVYVPYDADGYDDAHGAVADDDYGGVADDDYGAVADDDYGGVADDGAHVLDPVPIFLLNYGDSKASIIIAQYLDYQAMPFEDSHCQEQ